MRPQRIINHSIDMGQSLQQIDSNLEVSKGDKATLKKPDLYKHLKQQDSLQHFPSDPNICKKITEEEKALRSCLMINLPLEKEIVSDV